MFTEPPLANEGGVQLAAPCTCALGGGGAAAGLVCETMLGTGEELFAPLVAASQLGISPGFAVGADALFPIDVFELPTRSANIFPLPLPPITYSLYYSFHHVPVGGTTYFLPIQSCLRSASYKLYFRSALC